MVERKQNLKNNKLNTKTKQNGNKKINVCIYIQN